MARPWMPLYVADYLADTAHLTAAESGAYLHLIMHYWLNNGLPDDDKKLARIARMTDKEWRAAKTTIAEFFHDGWRHGRIDAELAEAASKSDAARSSAKKRWDKRKGGEADANAYANAMPPDMPSECSSLSPSQKEPTSSTANPLDERQRPRSRAELDRIERACREAAGVVDSPSAPGKFYDLSVILGFIDAGVSLEETILPVMRAKKAKGIKAFSWDFFADPIREAAAKRAGTAANCPAPPSPGDEIVKWDHNKMPAKNLELALRRYVENPSSWLLSVWGDPPPKVPFLLEFAAKRGIPIEAPR
jgi:uncharacterized protein YdaU (DUF1376 family)